jgi:hypothetical protein
LERSKHEPGPAPDLGQTGFIASAATSYGRSLALAILGIKVKPMSRPPPLFLGPPLIVFTALWHSHKDFLTGWNIKTHRTSVIALNGIHAKTSSGFYI